MTDTIRGPVTNIVDGDTFDIKVTYTGKDNKTDYNKNERIRIVEINAPELNTLAGKREKKHLEKILTNKEVRCCVQARDTYGRIVAKVKIL
jgi:endonuclease YncB( thermonuclease family)